MPTPEMISELWYILQKQSLADLHLIVAEALHGIIKRIDNAGGHAAACSCAENRLNIMAICIIFFTLVISGAQRNIRTVLILLFAFAGSILKLFMIHFDFVSSSALLLCSSVLWLPDALSLIQFTLQLISSNVLHPGTEYLAAVCASHYFKGLIIALTVSASVYYDAPWISVPVFLFLLRWSLATMSTALTLVIEFMWVIRNVYEVLLFSILPILIIRIGAVGLNMPTNHEDFHRKIYFSNCFRSVDGLETNGQDVDKNGIFSLISILCMAALEASRKFLITTANRKINHPLSKFIKAVTNKRMNQSLKKSESAGVTPSKIIESCITQISPEDYQRCVRETPWSRLSISSSANTSTETYKSDSKNIEIFGEKNVTSTCCDNGTIDNDFLCLESNKYKAQYENENSSRSEVNYHSPIVGTITTPTIPKFINGRKSSILHVLQARKLRIRQSGGQYLSYSPCQNMAKLNKNTKNDTNNDSDEPSDGLKLSALEGESAEIAVSKNVLSEVNEGTIPATNNDKNHRNAYYSSTGEMEINNSPSRPKTPAMSLLSIFSPRPFHPTLTRQVSEFFQRSCDGDPLCFTFKPPPPCTLSISAIAALYPPFLKGTIIPGNLPVIENIPVREGMIQRTGSLDSTEDEHFIRIPVDNILLAREYPEGGLTLTSLEDVSSSQSDLYPDTDPNNVVQSPSPVPSVIILGTEANYCSQKTSESRCNALPNKILKTLAGKYEAEEAAYLMTENDSSILAWRRVEVEEELLRSPIAPKSTPQSTKKVYKLTNILDPELEEIIELKNVSFLIQQIEGKEVTKNSKQSIALL